MRMPAGNVVHAVLAGLVTLATAAVLSVSVTTPAAAADTWTEVGSDRADPLTESQGLTSVEVPAGRPNHYAGMGAIPIGVSSRGWNHVGDPDASYNGYYVSRTRPTPAAPRCSGYGARRCLVGVRPRAEPGEALNNSFDTISPDGQWMVSGEWGT